MWDTTSGHVLAELRGYTGRPCRLVIANDGRTLAAGDEQGRLLLWDTSSLDR
jgi:hypothetical protein